MITDVTDKMLFDLNDEEGLPVIKCICGKEFKRWEFIIHNDSTDLIECPGCDRKFYFINTIKIFEVTES